MTERNILSVREAHIYLVQELGDLAPAYETFRTWLRPSFRAKRGVPEAFPALYRIPGVRRRAVRKCDLDEWIALLNRSGASRRRAAAAPRPMLRRTTAF